MTSKQHSVPKGETTLGVAWFAQYGDEPVKSYAQRILGLEEQLEAAQRERGYAESRAESNGENWRLETKRRMELEEALIVIRDRRPEDLGYVQFVQHEAYVALNRASGK